MKALPLLYYVLCLTLYSCAVPQTQRQRLNSRSLTSSKPPPDIFHDISWLVSMPGNCQGIILSPWWILSTGTCLKKTKLSRLKISGISDQESFVHGRKICLHPKFDPNGRKDSIKGDIGLVLLENFIHKNDVSLSHVPNVSLKSCSKCLYSSCQVFQNQGITEFGIERVKKMEVHLLDISMCHHQHSNLEKTEGFCILSHSQRDCLVKQASPVLCLLKNHWELVGLTHQTATICHKPTVIIRISPYLTWMKQIIKASKNPLNPTPPLQCKIWQESKNVPHVSHGHNYTPTMASHKSLEKNFGTKHLKNSPEIFPFDGVSFSPGSHKYFSEKSEIPQAGRFLVEQVSTSAVARLSENPRKNSPQYHQNIHLLDEGNSLDSQVASTGKASVSQLISDTTILHSLSGADMAKPENQPIENIDETWEQIMANIINQWSPSENNQDEPLDSHDTGSWTRSPHTTDESWGNFNISTIEQLRDYTARSWGLPRTTTANPSTTYKKGPWKSFIPTKSNKTTSVSHVKILSGSSETLDPYLSKSKWIPRSTITNDPRKYTSEYYKAKSRDQFITDSRKPQNYPTFDMYKLQSLSITNLEGSPTPPKMITKATSLENKITLHQALFQGQSSRKVKRQSAANNEP